MLGELLTEIRSYTSDRIRNPLLGPFTAAWIVANWKPLSVLFGSNDPIKTRILFIEENYTNLNLIVVAPLVFTLLYALALPWINLGIQKWQEGVNLRRRKHKLSIDTKYLEASLTRAEAQAAINRVLAKDEITRKQKEEIDQLKKDLDDSQDAAKASIAAKEEELEQRRKEFEERAHSDSSAVEKESREIEELKKQLNEERAKAKSESMKVRAELSERQKELEERLREDIGTSLISSNIDFESLLLKRKFRLFHNPSVGPERSKQIKFEPDGRIVEGSNKFENTWRISKGKLELIQADGKVHSRFFYLPDSQIFIHTGDKDTKSARGQYIIPETDK